MPISRLALTDFRNYAAALIEPGPGFVLLSGDNGAGKTNVLEAVSLLTPGRGLRGAALGEMARSEGLGGFAVAATLNPRPFRGGEEPRSGEGAGESDDYATDPFNHGLPRPSAPSSKGVGEVNLGTGTLATAPDRRQVRINGAPASVNALAEWLSVLWLTPAMDRLFTDSAGARRRFLDRLVLALEPGHAHHAARYEAAMRARNKLLAEDRWDEEWLGALESQMGEHGRAVSMARMRTVKQLSEAIWEREDDDFPKSRLFQCNLTSDLETRLAASRRTDASARRATHGPNNEDLKVVYGENDRDAAQCSTGEQKALLLGIVLGHADLVAGRRGAAPILLLDEVAAHLDPGRRVALFARLEGRGQVWMTATEPALFEGIAAATHYAVVGSEIRPR